MNVLSEFWQKKSMIIHFAKMNIKLRYRSAYLGILWAALEPLFMFMILYMVFTSIRETTADFPIYLITGIMVYTLFTKGTMGGLASIEQNSAILKSIKIRTDVFPLITTCASGLLLFVNVIVFFVLMPVFDFVPSWTIVMLPILLFLLLVLILGVSYLLSIVYVFVKDIQPIWTVIVYGMMFVSPLFWYLDDAGGLLLEIHKINPLGQIIEIGHKLVFGTIPSLSEWLYATFLVCLILVAGYMLFRKFEAKAIEEL